MNQDFLLIDKGWDKLFDHALKADQSSLRIVCPFIKTGVANRLLNHGIPAKIQIITRFNLKDFCNGVSDTTALRLLLENGAQIRGVRNLHAKLYLFGSTQAVLTSANLTDQALTRNHEFGFVAKDTKIVGCCEKYFDGLWGRSGTNLTVALLDEWEQKLSTHLAGGSRPSERSGLGDEGVDAGETEPPIELPPLVGEAPQAFVKFFGLSSERAELTMPVLEEIKRTGSHWACTYPKGKRPRSVKDGATMFMARIVKDPNDIIIIGRAVGMRHEPVRDDATVADIKLRTWKEKWPHYVRVHHAEFVAGSLVNGVSLNELMSVLKSNAFVPTQRNAALGAGNTDPRRAYMQQAAVELTRQGITWLNGRLEEAFEQYGKIAPKVLDQLDWPKIPYQTTGGNR